jgi:hypothetical protein
MPPGGAPGGWFVFGRPIATTLGGHAMQHHSADLTTQTDAKLIEQLAARLRSLHPRVDQIGTYSSCQSQHSLLALPRLLRACSERTELDPVELAFLLGFEDVFSSSRTAGEQTPRATASRLEP